MKHYQLSRTFVKITMNVKDVYAALCAAFNKDIVPEKWEIKLELKKTILKKHKI